MSHVESLPLLAAAVDRLAAIKAQQADLAREADDLKDLLADSGLPVVLGTLHRATISHQAGRTITDWRAVAERCGASRQLIAAHTSTGEACVVVRLAAHRAA